MNPVSYANPPTATTPGPPRALYVHVPFCRVLCGYCDFFSVLHDAAQTGPLVTALLTELDRARQRHPDPVETIFVGGGTPTTLSPAELERLLAACRAAADPHGPLEFTVEANPATVTPEKAAVLHAAGVTRVSLGAQSFDPRELTVLDRDHNPDDVPRTLAILRDAGLTNLSLDLIFAVPGQTLPAWQANLDRALALATRHLSCYGLTYEPATRLHARRAAGRVQPVDNAVEAAMFEHTIERLAAAGFAQYEISNFAPPGFECRHNLVYWRNESYLGIGPSAAGYIDNVRYRNVPHLHRYVAAINAGASAWIESETPDRRQQIADTLMMGLRLRAGIERSRFAARFEADVAALFPAVIARYVNEGLLELSPGHLRLTEGGLLLADTIIADFLATD